MAEYGDWVCIKQSYSRSRLETLGDLLVEDKIGNEIRSIDLHHVCASIFGLFVIYEYADIARNIIFKYESEKHG